VKDGRTATYEQFCVRHITVAYLHTKTPKVHFGAFLLLCIRPLLGIMSLPLHCEPRRVSRASLAAASPLYAQHKVQTHMTDTHTVTTLVICPVTLCMTFTSAVTFAVNARGASLHPSMTIKRLRILLLRAFVDKLIPQSLLTARLGNGIQHDRDDPSY